MNALHGSELNDDINTVTTTLYDLIASMQETTAADDDDRIAPAVKRMFEAGQIRFLSKMARLN